jgi:hypothetical protein
MFEPIIGTPDEFAKIIMADTEKWRSVIREARIELD